MSALWDPLLLFEWPQSMPMVKVIIHITLITVLYSLLTQALRAITDNIHEDLKVFSKDELKNQTSLLLSICGHVFDVSSGDRFHGTGGSYEDFSSIDATRALSLADPSKMYLDDNISDFSGEQCIAAENWLNHFLNHETYKQLGVLNGYFFDESGVQTNGMRRFKQCLANGLQIKRSIESNISHTYEDIEPPDCDRIVTDDRLHIISCNAGYTPRKSYFTAGHSVDIDGTSRSINIISCECLRLNEVNQRPDLLLYHSDCHPNGTECIFDNHELDIHH